MRALRRALKQYVPPQISNTDQGIPFTSAGWVGLLTDRHIAIVKFAICEPDHESPRAIRFAGSKAATIRSRKNFFEICMCDLVARTSSFVD